MKRIAERPKHVYISARYLRKEGPRNAGWRVRNMHPPALADTWTLLMWNREQMGFRGKTAYKTPVYDLHRRIARESEMNRREAGSPHEQDDAAEVESVAERGGGW
jgi:hypothetical protein